MSIILNGTTGITTPDLTSTDYIETNGAVLYPLTSGTAVATTSGTSIDFTSIPSWVNRITMVFKSVSTNGSALVGFRIGDGAFISTGYVGVVNRAQTGVSNAGVAYSTSFAIINGSHAGVSQNGTVVLTHIGGNVWNFSGIAARDENVSIYTCSGTLTLVGVLDRVQLTTEGSDTFDAGSINIMYE
tara:strand:+ start:265 stop:822 length:558 start_codon:yes stop_codon:yes gene_type:complete